MKIKSICKTLIIGITLLFLFSVPFSIAASNFTIESLLEKWKQDGYPDDFGGACINRNKNYIIFLVSPTEQRISEIRSMFSNKDVEFINCAYSYNDLERVQTEISSDLGSKQGLYSVGIGGMIDKNGAILQFGNNKNGARVTVGVDKNYFKEYSNEYKVQYGDMVHVEIGGMAVANEEKSLLSKFLPFICVSILLTTVLLFVLGIKNQKAMRLSTGEVTICAALSRKDILEKIKNSNFSPATNLIKNIFDEES